MSSLANAVLSESSEMKISANVEAKRCQSMGKLYGHGARISVSM
jgi:hypothetical protein